MHLRQHVRKIKADHNLPIDFGLCLFDCRRNIIFVRGSFRGANKRHAEMFNLQPWEMDQDDYDVTDPSIIDMPVTRDVNSLVKHYLFLTKRGSAATIEIAELIVIADSQLAKDEKDLFDKKAGLAKRKSFRKKLCVIGKKAERFRDHLDKLPNCWTTIYKLAQLSDRDFETQLEYGLISQTMKASDISVKSDSESKGKEGDQPEVFEQRERMIISISGIAPAGRVELEKKLKGLGKKFKFELQLEVEPEMDPLARNDEAV